MWKCSKCGKPVYFAERKTSIGKDWHPECLRCNECGRRLDPGQHAEHKGVPYCHVPCYGALFGPQLFGHGTKVESHKSFGDKSPKHRDREQLESKLKAYNDYYDSKSLEIKSREVNGRLVLEGALRIYWGVSGIIHLKEEGDERTVVTVRKRNSWRYRHSANPDLSSDRQMLISQPPDDTTSENYDTTISESISYDTISISSEVASLNSNSNASSKHTSPSHKSDTLPPKLDVKKMNWNELDELLQVERQVDDHERPYQTMPSPLPSSNSTEFSDDKSVYKSFTESTTAEATTTAASEEAPKEASEVSLYETPPSTLKPTDYEEFDRAMIKEFINGANNLQSVDDDTLKANQPIDPSRINDSLKLYNDNVMNKSFSENHSSDIPIVALPATGALNINDTFTRMRNQMENAEGTLKYPANHRLQKSSSATSSVAVTPEEETSSTLSPQRVMRSKSGPNFYNNLVNSDDSDTETLKANPKSRSIYLKMDCYDEVNANDNESGNVLVLASPNSFSEKNRGFLNDDGVVLRKPPRTGSTAIKRRSGNRRSRTKLKRRCSINGHFYNRETSFFTPPHGSQMSVWVTSLTNTQEIVNLLLEKYKVESKAENFALFVVKDNGEQRRLKDDDYPLVSRITLGPHEEVAKIFLMDAEKTQEISNEVAQFLNLSVAECRAILEKYYDEEERELYKVQERYAELRRRIVHRMESLKVRL